MNFLLFLRLCIAAMFSFLAISAGAISSDIASVTIVGKGTVSPNYDGQTLTNGVKYSMTAKPAKGFVFAGWSGSLTSTKPKLTFTNVSEFAVTATFKDNQKPTATINPVPNSTALVENSFYAGGTARDNDAVSNVLCQLNGGGFTPASTLNGWSNWWFAVTLNPGTNYLEAYSVDVNGLFSKTNKVKLIYTVTPSSLAGTTLYVTGGGLAGLIDFATNTFTSDDGAGTYTYKKTSSIFGKLSLAYSAPPSAVGAANNVNVMLQFDSATAGVIGETSSFTLVDDNGWAPPTLGNSTLLLTAADGSSETILSFPNLPAVAAGTLTNVPNPYPVPLDDDYPGNVGDRVKVWFARAHYVSQSNQWFSWPNQAFAGSVIEITATGITVLFDTPPKNDKANYYSLLAGADLDILTCTVASYVGDAAVGTNAATFTFTNTSPDGAVLKVMQGSTNQYYIMSFTNDVEDGIYYAENYLSTNLTGTGSGTFSIALSPQIASQPQSLTVTNGGTASFGAIFKGSPVITYQWQFNTTNLADGATGWGSTISGSATTNLVITGVTSNDLGNYRVIAANFIGSATSSSATLSFPTPPQPPSITNQPPVTQTVTNGNQALISVSATGTAPLSFQWQMFGTNLVNSGNISGVTTSNLFFNPAYTNNTGNYQVIITNAYGAVTSSVSYLSVQPASSGGILP